MLETHVALVPSSEGIFGTKELLHVAASLQIQLTRDVGPLWGLPAVISPFITLEDVPPGYIPLVIVPENRLERHGGHSFHIAAGDRPLALVEFSPVWSVVASHELICMIIDPWGRRHIRGTSLRDTQTCLPATAGVPHSGHRHDYQGQVEYLVEPPDPIGASSYPINGVLVSDFVTPSYYDAFDTGGARYSFTGRVTAPRQLLRGGYLTWRARRASEADGRVIEEIWQAFAPAGDHLQPRIVDTKDFEITELKGIPPKLSRRLGHLQSTSTAPEKARVTEARARLQEWSDHAKELALSSAHDYGTILRRDVETVLKSLETLPDYGKVVALLEELAKDDNEPFRKEFAENPGAKLRELGIGIAPGDLVPSEGRPLPEPAAYRELLGAVTEGHTLGRSFSLSDLSKALGTEGVYIR
jgi:hypothetical protein